MKYIGKVWLTLAFHLQEKRDIFLFFVGPCLKRYSQVLPTAEVFVFGDEKTFGGLLHKLFRGIAIPLFESNE